MISLKKNEFLENIDKCEKLYSSHDFENKSFKIEVFVECMKDWSTLSNYEQVKEWYLSIKGNASMKVEEIGVLDCKDWYLDKNDGYVKHISNKFFLVQGLKVTEAYDREVSNWDQPIITENNYDIGLLGIIRKNFNSVPHYLVEAKSEPGNPGLVQISPTIQATSSNLNRVHLGRNPLYKEIFSNTNNNGFFVVFDQLCTEDGGRLNNKKNRGMIVQASDEFDIPIYENFNWLSLFQIKKLISETDWVNPHVRSLISSL